MRDDKPASLADAIRRRPFLSAAVLFILGICAHGQLPARPMIWIAAAGALLPLATAARARTAAADVGLAMSVFLGGLSAAQIEAYFYPPDHISRFTTAVPRLAWLELRIIEPPRLLSGDLASPRRASPRQATQARVLRIRTDAGWQTASGTLLLNIDQPIADLAVAQQVVALGMLHRPQPPANPGQFDWAGYYREQRILGSFFIGRADNLRIVSRPPPGLLARLRQWVRDTLRRGFTPEQSLDHALLRALVLGDSDPQLRDVQDYFTRTGTSHHLAISGMHIAIIGGLVLGLCRLLLLSPRTAVWIGLVVVVLYGLVALPSPPVVRSVLLCIAFGVGVLLRRSIDGIQLLSLSILAVLVYHPLDLYNAGFQLSFGTVLGLMLLAGPLHKFLRGFGDRHAAMAQMGQVRTVRQATMGLFRDWLVQAVVAGAVAWAVSAPLIAWHFNQINPWTIPASLALAIPVFLALVGGFLKIILSAVLPPLDWLWAELAASPVALMRQCVEALARVPGSDASLVQPPVWLILLFYLLLALPLLPRGRRLAMLPRAGPALAGVLVLLVPLLLGSSSPLPAGRFRLTLLSVGEGQCAVLHLPSGRTVLIDAGSASFSDLSRRCITPYLKSLGQRRIDAVFISHANYDHFSAVEDALAAHAIQRVYTNGAFAQHAVGNAPAQDLLDALASAGLTPTALSAGQRLRLDEQTSIEVLWPPGGLSLSPNDSSLVLRLTCHGRSILFPGDIQDLAQAHLLGNPDSLRSDVLVAPHHGSHVGSSEQFLAAVDPRFVLCSNGHALSQRQRAFDDLARGRVLCRTHRRGAAMVDIRVDGSLTLQTFLAPR